MLRKCGFNPDFVTFRNKHRKWFASVLGSPLSMSFLLIPLLCGGMAYAYFLCMVVGGSVPWCAVLLFTLLSPWVFSSLQGNRVYWEDVFFREEGSSLSVEKRIERYHQYAENPSGDVAKKILAVPLDRDARIAMWQISALGMSYRFCSNSLRKEIEVRFGHWIDQYSSWPVNQRYKLVDAAARIPNLYTDLDRICEGEKQLYVRWYAENRGFGRGVFLF